MRTTLVLPLVGAAVVTAGALFLRIGRKPAVRQPGVIPLPVDRSSLPRELEPALPDRLRAQGF
jgi:hypothetical protein